MRILFALISFLLFAGNVAAQEAPKRPLYTATYAQVEQAVGEQLALEGAGEMVLATVVGKSTNEAFRYHDPLLVQVSGLTLQKDQQRWSANIVFVAGDEVATALPMSGRYEEAKRLPVLKRPVRAGDVIREEDIGARVFALRSTPNEAIADASQLIGKTPQRSISPNRPVRESELARPALVEKDAAIELRFAQGGIEITTSGMAMSQGAMGDVISVRNNTSKKIVHARVTGANSAEVLAAGNSIPTKVAPL